MLKDVHHHVLSEERKLKQLGTATHPSERSRCGTATARDAGEHVEQRALASFRWERKTGRDHFGAQFGG